MPVVPSAQPLSGTAHRYVRVDDARGLPVTVKILLEGVRRVGGDSEQKAAEALARYPRDNASVPFRPSRILLQDYTGVPAAVDLAAMRAAMQRAGKDPAKIEPLIPVDLIIDHSVQADFFGAKDVYERNLEREYERNRDRPRAHAHRALPQEGRREQVHRIHWRRPLLARRRRARDRLEHVPGIRRDERALPGGPPDAPLPRADRAAEGAY